MELPADEKRIRDAVHRFNDGIHWLGSWLLLYGTPTIVAMYAYARDELDAMLLLWVAVLGVSAYQFFEGYRRNRILQRLLGRYEQSHVEQAMSTDARSTEG